MAFKKNKNYIIKKKLKKVKKKALKNKTRKKIKKPKNDLFININ